MGPPIPDFDTAVKRLQNFMTDLGLRPGDLVWIFPEDMSNQSRKVHARVPLLPSNERIARAGYEQGRNLGIGVCLNVFCRLGSAYCCTCWFVRDFEEGARRLCGGLKLSVANELPDVQPIRSRLPWPLCRWFDAKSGLDYFRDFLPPYDGCADWD